MLNFIIKRLLYGLLVVLGVILVIFLLFNVLPGDPARMMLGQRSDLTSVNAIRKDLGLDQPQAMQFLNYLNDLSPLSYHNIKDKNSYWFLNPEKYKVAPICKIGKEGMFALKFPYLRRSYQSKKNVADILLEALPNTAILAIASMIFALIIGIIIGILSAVFKDSLFDKASLFVAAIGMSLPSFFAAILIAWAFAFVLADYTGLNMFGSLYSVDDMGRGEYIEWKNLILPALTLGIRPLAVLIQLTRNAMLDTLSQDYIRTARSKGLSFFRIIRKHALPNSLNPVITAFSGWLASLMAGAVFIEYVFDWKGIGVVIVNALEKYDFPVLMGSVLMVSVILVLINILVDITYSLLDPRIKLQ